MRRLRAWLLRAAAQLGLGRADRRFDDEIASHLQLHIDDNLRVGMSSAEARRAALLALGGAARVRDEYRDRAGVPALRVLADASREGGRSLVRHPAFSLALVGILSVGVGATAALAGLVDTLLFRPPAHVVEPERLAQVAAARNFVLFEEIDRRVTSLDVAAIATQTLSLGEGDASRPIDALCVTWKYFRVLGATPVVGRTFLPDEDVRGGARAVVLGYGLWRRDFGGARDAVGRSVSIAGQPHRVVGVAPADFRGLQTTPVDAWVLLRTSPEICSFIGRSLLDSASGSWLTTIGRLGEDVEFERADAEVRALGLPRRAAAGGAPPALVPVQTGTTVESADGRLAVWLAAGAGFLLAIACANVAGLLSVRAVERRREVALRAQLGASRGRLFTQLLAENLVLTASCAVGAWAVSIALTGVLRRWFPALAGDGWVDTRSLLILATFALGAGLVSGLLPAVQASRVNAAMLRIGHALGQSRTRWRDALIVAQVTLAVVLVSGASLFALSVRQAKSNLGYELNGVVVATLDLERSGIRRQVEQRRIFDQILDNLGQLPNVEAASLSTMGPLGSGTFATVMPSARGGMSRTMASVSPGYFRTLGTRIVSGRPFTAADGPGAPSVAIVDANLAREIWPGEDVVGHCKPLTPGRPCIEIVGISEPRRMQSLTRVGGEIFHPLAQDQRHVPQTILVRTGGSARDAVPVVASAIRRASSALPFVDVRPLEDLADVQARSWRLGAMLFGLFGGVALALAAVGLYASLAFIVRQRTAEIGLRIALGAAPRQAAGVVFRHGAWLASLGWLIGLAASVALGAWIQSRLFGVAAANPATLAAASLAVGIAAAAGCALPVIRATRVDPLVALRHE
jgi:predicted permease